MEQREVAFESREEVPARVAAAEGHGKEADEPREGLTLDLGQQGAKEGLRQGVTIPEVTGPDTQPQFPGPSYLAPPPHAGLLSSDPRLPPLPPMGPGV